MRQELLRPTAEEFRRFQERHAPTFEGYRRAKQVEEATRTDIDQAVSDLAKAEASNREIRTWDRRALAWSPWAQALVILLLAAGEFFVNYLAAKGLLQDETTTWGVTVFLTFVLGLLTFGLAREHRRHRLDQAEGRLAAPGGSRRTTLASLVVLTVAYLVLSLFLRQRYFSFIAIVEGLPLSNPWFIGSVLTLLAGIGIGAIVYVVSHVNGELARARRHAAQMEHALPKLRDANRDAYHRVEQITQDIDADAHKSSNAVLLRLDDPRPGDDEEIADYLKAAWRRIVTWTSPVHTDEAEPAPPPSGEPLRRADLSEQKSVRGALANLDTDPQQVELKPSDSESDSGGQDA